MSDIELASKEYVDSKGSGEVKSDTWVVQITGVDGEIPTMFTPDNFYPADDNLIKEIYYGNNNDGDGGGVIRFKKEMTQLEAANYMNCEYILPRTVDWGEPTPLCLYAGLVSYCNVCYAWPKDMPFPRRKRN